MSNDLPPLPEPFMDLNRDIVPCVYAAWADQMHAYARAAIEADRQSRLDALARRLGDIRSDMDARKAG